MSSKAINWMDERSILHCITCGAQIIDSGTYCTSCETPIQVSRSVANRNTPARLISVLGASGAGKTVYLGMLLDMLNKGTGGLRGLPNGAFSLGVQEQTITALENRRFPEKTPSEADHWQWVHCETFDEKSPKRKIDLITPDLAGEALALELEKSNTFPTIRTMLRNVEGVVILFDSERVKVAPRSEDIFGVKLVSYLADVNQRPTKERRNKIRLPMSFVFTKADVCADAEDDPQHFAKTHLPGLLQFCERRFERFEFFAASVVGGSTALTDNYGAQIQIPLHVQPRCIVEPLHWVMRQMDKRLWKGVI